MKNPACTKQSGRILLKLKALAAAGTVMGLVLGCVEGKTPMEKFHSRMRADPAPLSCFLPDHQLLEKQPNTFPFHYFYFKDTGKRYDRVYIAPVDVSQLRESSSWAEFDKELAGTLGTKMEDITSFMKKAYEQAFRQQAASSHLEVVEAPDRKRGTLVVETAIIAFCPTKAELNAAGIAANFVVPGLGLVTSAVFGGGLITIECRVRDAETGEIVSMYATTETEPRALLPVAQFTWSTSAQINIKQIAAYTVQVYTAAHNYRSVHRRFPLRWAALIKDGQLEEDEK